MPGISSFASPRRRRSHLFIELEECHTGEKWRETGRWNHALEEESFVAKGGSQAWSRPHLPTISFRALVDLRAALSSANVMLDVPGSSFIEVVDEVLVRLVKAKSLQQSDVARTRAHFERLTSAEAGSPPVSPLVSASMKGPPSPALAGPRSPAQTGPRSPAQTVPRSPAMAGGSGVPPPSPGGEASRTRLAVVPKLSPAQLPTTPESPEHFASTG